MPLNFPSLHADWVMLCNVLFRNVKHMRSIHVCVCVILPVQMSIYPFYYVTRLPLMYVISCGTVHLSILLCTLIFHQCMSLPVEMSTYPFCYVPLLPLTYVITCANVYVSILLCILISIDVCHYLCKCLRIRCAVYTVSSDVGHYMQVSINPPRLHIQMYVSRLPWAYIYARC